MEGVVEVIWKCKLSKPTHKCVFNLQTPPIQKALDPVINLNDFKATKVKINKLLL